MANKYEGTQTEKNLAAAFAARAKHVTSTPILHRKQRKKDSSK